MTETGLHAVAIAGVGLTRQAKHQDRSTFSLCLEAARDALDDAGLAKEDVDGIAARWPGPGGTVFLPGSADWAEQLGIPVRWIGDTYPQGIPAALDAAAAIAAGLCHTVLVFGGQSGGVGRGGGKVAEYTRPDNEFVVPWGAFTAAHFALVANAYLERYDIGRERLAAIAAAIRNTGSDNPRAVMAGRGPYTAQDVLASPMIAEPFTLLDLCLVSEGAAAMVLTTLERARAARRPPIRILGGGAEWMRQQYVNPARFDDVVGIGADAGRRAFAMSGLRPADLDVLELYDTNSYEVVRQLEALGFCGPGEGADFALERGIGVDGRLPINTDGGLMSFSHIGWGGPTLKVVEAVRQLRGEGGALQVPGAETALLTGAGAGAQYHNVMILGRDR
jgi:acetyl-CoA acetyltransferase